MTIANTLELLGGRRYIKKEIHNRLELYELVQQGIYKGALDVMQANTGLTSQEIAFAFPVSTRTLCRYKKQKKLSPSISERLVELAELFSIGIGVFEKADLFYLWLRSPSVALGNKPINLIGNAIGIDILKDELGRIEHGVMA